MPDCIFCKIVQGEIPSSKVYEDDRVLVFKDINPQAPVHLLVIPKRHIADLNQLTPADGDLAAHLISVVQQAAREAGVAESGYRLITNTGPDSGQVVFHLHFHILGGRKLHAMG